MDACQSALSMPSPMIGSSNSMQPTSQRRQSVVGGSEIIEASNYVIRQMTKVFDASICTEER
jgi:hypothetical protein